MVTVTCELPELFQGYAESDAVPLWRFLIGCGGKSKKYGSVLRQHTKDWQEAHGLKADGIVGRKSWTEALNDLNK